MLPMLDRSRVVALAIALASPVPVQAQKVSGHVFRGDTGQPLVGAYVTVLEHDAVLVETRTDSKGAFHFASVGGDDLVLIARAPGFLTSPPLPVEAVGGAAAPVLIELQRAADPDSVAKSGIAAERSGRRGRLIGRVQDPQGAPLAGATVHIGDRPAITDASGVFEMEDTFQPREAVIFERLGYATVRDTITVADDAGLFMRVTMAPEAIPLEPLVVTVVSRRSLGRLDDLRRRLKAGMGDIVTQKEFTLRGNPSFGQFLQSQPGVNIIGGKPVFRKSFSLGEGWCPPTFYLDGMKLSSWQSAMSIGTLDLELVELYKGPAQTPAEFIDSDSRCGVVVIWTRRGSGIPYADLVDWRVGKDEGG